MVFIDLSNSPEKLIIDDWHAEYFYPYTWHKTSDGYGRTTISNSKWYAHNWVMSGFQNHLIDHRSGSKLDCQESNLRVTDYVGNNGNIKRPECGVFSVGEKWQAVVKHKGKILKSELLDDYNECVEKYENKMDMLFGAGNWRRESKTIEAGLI